MLLGESYGSAGDFGICEHVLSSGCQQLVMQRCLCECVLTLASILSGSISTALGPLALADSHFIERRGALLRDTDHWIEGQLKEEGMKMQIGSILAEAVFCGSALLSINGSSPYNAVYGRVPQILPSIDQVRPPGDEREPATF